MTKPSSIADVIMHTKTSEEEDVITLPVTRYANVMNSPTVVTHPSERPGAPFHLYAQESELLDDSEINALCGPIV